MKNSLYLCRVLDVLESFGGLWALLASFILDAGDLSSLLFLALAPSVISLSRIYQFHFLVFREFWLSEALVLLIFSILFLIDLCSYIGFLPVSEAGYLKGRIISIRAIMFVENKIACHKSSLCFTT